MIESIILAVGAKLSGIAGYTVLRSPIHLVEEKNLPVIIYSVERITQLSDMDFNHINWEASLSISAVVKSRTNSEQAMLAAHTSIHEALYADRHLLPLEGVYVYLGDEYGIRHDDTGAQTISVIESQWAIQYRTTNLDLSN